MRRPVPLPHPDLVVHVEDHGHEPHPDTESMSAPTGQDPPVGDTEDTRKLPGALKSVTDAATWHFDPSIAVATWALVGPPNRRQGIRCRAHDFNFTQLRIRVRNEDRSLPCIRHEVLGIDPGSVKNNELAESSNFTPNLCKQRMVQ